MKKSLKKYSRLYGYQNDNNKIPQPVPSEIEIIKKIFKLLSLGTTPKKIKQYLDSEGIRNRSGNRFSEAQIVGLCKPIYTGNIDAHMRWMVKSVYYPPIVSMKEYKKALKFIRSLNQKAA